VPDTKPQRVALDPPTVRPLKVYAFDPSQGRLLGNEMTLLVPYEELSPGPVGRRIAVVDYDASQGCYYDPVDLDDRRVLIRGGLDPSESDPHFHQQMTYAVVVETLAQFEAALGRRVHWRSRGASAGVPGGHGRIGALKLYPHAMAERNGFYSPAAHGILFGYFRASETSPGRNLPGQTVFTCLSHDIVAHETTHAVIDGIREYFTEPTNADVIAFHEAFADLVALFRHFSHQPALLDTLRKTGGRLFDASLRPTVGRSRAGEEPLQVQRAQDNPLVGLARQFGEASGGKGALRAALGKEPTPQDYEREVEPHARGSVLVAAVFDAYFSTYLRRSENLFRLHRSSPSRTDDLPAPMAELLADEASRTAQRFFRLCVRALDFSPPVDVTFGDFLRALVTVHTDLEPDDADGVRSALMEAFRLRGILPDGARFFSEDALCWPSEPPDSRLPPVEGLVFGDPNGLTREEQDRNGDVLRGYGAANAGLLGLDPDPARKVSAPSFHPTFRVGADGRLRTEMVVELVQQREVPVQADAPERGSMTVRGGATVIVSKPLPDELCEPTAPRIRFVICKAGHGEEGARREAAQRAFLLRSGFPARRAEDAPLRVDFGLVHRGL
jgi:hypothetical protein